jgi:hypothetical protein
LSHRRNLASRLVSDLILDCKLLAQDSRLLLQLLSDLVNAFLSDLEVCLLLDGFCLDAFANIIKDILDLIKLLVPIVLSDLHNLCMVQRQREHVIFKLFV